MIHSLCLLLLLSTREGLVVACQGEPVSHVVDLDLLHGLLAACLADIEGLDDRLEVLLTCELQHLQHLGPASDMAATNLASVGRKVLRHHLGQWLVGQTDVVELAVHCEGRHVLRQVEGVRHIGTVEDEVKREGPRFRPLLFVGANELLGAQCKGVFLLVWAMRDCVGFRTQGIGPDNTEVAESTTNRPLA